MYDDAVMRPWYDDAVASLSGVTLFDIHTHIGSNDPDGFALESGTLIAELEAVGSRAAVMPMREPGGYLAANDRVLEVAAASGGLLVPFCRLDPAREPLIEAARCYDTGARGIKLHPRSDAFDLQHLEIDAIFAFAHERRLPVLVHAGRGIPTLARDALRLAAAYPDARVILAHAGICDLNWIWRELPRYRNVFFDLSWWHPSDLMALFTFVPPGQLLYGSDLPYFTPTLTATLVARYGRQAGLSPVQLAAVLGDQGRRVIAGEDPLDVGPAPGVRTGGYSLLLDRVTSWLVLAVGRMMLGDSGYEPLALARLACDVGGDDVPEADVCRSVLALLEGQERYACEHQHEVTPEYPGIYTAMLAACVARTPDVPLPRIPELQAREDVVRLSSAGHRVIDLANLPPRHEVPRDLRRSSAADHLVVDPGTSRPSYSGTHAVQQPPPDTG